MRHGAIKPHTLDKFDPHAKFCSIFDDGMKNRWPDNRGYLDLFALDRARDRRAS